LNGDDIHNGENVVCDPGDHIPGDFAVKSGTVILPVPGSEDKYKIFYLQINNNIFSKLVYCDVDMGANNGLGAVTEKGALVLQDSLVDAIAAVKHGNGKDWWVILPRGVDEAYWTIRFTESGIEAPQLQVFPEAYTPFTYAYLAEIEEPPYLQETLLEEYIYEYSASQACFSHDGSKYLRLVKGQEVEIYDFDRCTGELSWKRSVPIPLFDYPQPYVYAPAGGLAISPNDRYLYFHNNMQLFQLDISPDSLLVSVPFLVDEYDGFYQDIPVFAANFFQMRNAPDGKIYMTSSNGVRVLHVIHQPDSAKLSCQFEQHGIALPRWTSWTLNYFPNFNIQELNCASNTKMPLKSPVTVFDIYPNPADAFSQIILKEPATGEWSIYNANGTLLHVFEKIQQHTFQLSTLNYPNGLYFVKYRDENGQVRTQKLMVQH
jgi:hypothetical protein